MREVVAAAEVTARLGPAEEYSAWVAELAGVDPPEPDITPAEPGILPDLLERLGVQRADAVEIVQTRLSPERDPELWWLLRRCHQVLVSGMGDLGSARPRWPHLPASFGPKGRYFYVHVFLAALPTLRRWHQERGLPDGICWATLADLGRQLAIHRRIHGVGGLDVQSWFTLHFRGLIYEFGRLQLNRGRIWFDDDAIVAMDAPFQRGDLALGIHIPESGSMTPQACDESFRQAKRFYATYFPEERYRYGVCTSWLLDDQLAGYLPESSNIIRFQRRFHLVPGPRHGDQDIFTFVFRKAGTPALSELPRHTTLERAILKHLEAGRHWKVRSGWLEL